MKKALICGISGQDGGYLAKLLINKGYSVIGTSRDAQISSFRNLDTLGIKQQIQLESMSIIDFRSVLQTIKKHRPDEIYNLAGQSSVRLSFEQPVETMESISIGTLNLLEAIRFMDSNIKLYNASSGECFGDTSDEKGANEDTAFKPKSPYAVAKATAFWQVANYRDAYKLFACSGILFNHESPLRPQRFVTKKIISTACRISLGSTEKLSLGNISINRDWGWAPEYVEAMYMMLQYEKAEDFVIATGKATSLKDFIKIVFNTFDLNWEDYTVSEKSLMRPTDHTGGLGNPAKAKELLNWEAKYNIKEIIQMMIDEELKTLKQN